MYLLSKIAGMLAEPSTLLLLVSLIGLLMTLRFEHSLRGKTLLCVGVGGLVACAVLPIGTWLLRPLENRFPAPYPMPGRVDGIVLVGGAVDVDESTDRGAPAFNDAAGRMTAFAALARRYPDAQLVFAGGNADPWAQKRTEAHVAREFAIAMGIDHQRFIFEAHSRNTRENAEFSRHLVTLKPGQRWLLVTSAADLPRAVGCFRAVGWPVIAVPADYHTYQHQSGFAPGLLTGLEQVDWAVHEWLGLIYYRLRGWTPALFPGPK